MEGLPAEGSEQPKEGRPETRPSNREMETGVSTGWTAPPKSPNLVNAQLIGRNQQLKPPLKAKGQDTDHLIGSWVNGDEYASDVEYVVERAGQGGFAVRAIDRFDNEEGTVYDVRYNADNSTLSFDVRWKSTGRFVSVRLQTLSPNRVSYTYSYTETQMWFRKGTEPSTKGKLPESGRRPSKTLRKPSTGVS
jgi:hypothetical protein